MLKYSETTKKFISVILALSAVIFAVGLFWAESVLAWLLGILLGTFVSVARLTLLERSINMALDMSSKDAVGYARAQYSFRYILTMLALVLAGITPHISLFGTIWGLLNMSFAAYLMKFFFKDKEEKLNL